MRVTPLPLCLRASVVRCLRVTGMAGIAILVLALPFASVALGAPTVSRVSPAIGMSTFAVELTVEGTGFVSGSTVRLGRTPLESVSVLSSSSLKATVPAGFQAGQYDLGVETPAPDPQISYLSKAYIAVSPAPALATGLRNPNKLATDTMMNLYVTDPQGRRVVVFDTAGQQRLVIANTDPLGIAVDREGRILVGDRRLKGIQVFSKTGQAGSTFGQGQLERPVDVAVDYASGWVYVADQRRNAILVFDGQGGLLSGGTAWKDQSGAPVQLSAPTAIALDRVRNEVLVADQNNGCVLIFSIPAASAPRTFVLKQSIAGSSSDVKFTRIHGLSVDADGRIYVSDAFDHLVQVVDRAGNRLGVLGGFGEGSGDLRTPSAVLLDQYKRIAVADWNNGRVNFYASAALPANLQTPTVQGITPPQGASGFSVPVTITGTGFMVGATLKLVAEGGSEVWGGNVQVVDSGYLTATFDLMAAPAGTWDVTLTNPDGQKATLSKAFASTAPDFRLAVSPTSQTVIPGGRTSFIATAAALNGFAGAVGLTLSEAPAAAQISPAQIKPGEAAAVSVPIPADAGLGPQTLVIQGAASDLVRQAQATVKVVEPATLRVFAQPVGTRVYLDGNYAYLGRFVGLAGYVGWMLVDQPLEVSGLLPGPHVLRLTYPGKREEYLRVVLDSGVNEVHVQLQNASPAPETWAIPIPIADAAGTPLRVPGPSMPFVLDWLGRGRKDLVVGDGEGDIHVFLDVGTEAMPRFQSESTARLILTDASGKSLRGDRGAAVFVVDWNNDGRQDLLVGDSSGTIRLYLNDGTLEAPLYAQPQLLQAGPAGAVPRDIRLPSRFVAPVVVDWDQDGRKDLVVGDEQGRLWLFRNRGTDAVPQLEPARPIYLLPEEFTPRAAPAFPFWDADGMLDLLVGRQDGRVIFYKRREGGSVFLRKYFGVSAGPLEDAPDVPLSFGADASPCILDWAGDGGNDILSGTFGGEILWSRPEQ